MKQKGREEMIVMGNGCGVHETPYIMPTVYGKSNSLDSHVIHCLHVPSEGSRLTLPFSLRGFFVVVDDDLLVKY